MRHAILINGDPVVLKKAYVSTSGDQHPLANLDVQSRAEKLAYDPPVYEIERVGPATAARGNVLDGPTLSLDGDHVDALYVERPMTPQERAAAIEAKIVATNDDIWEVFHLMMSISWYEAKTADPSLSLGQFWNERKAWFLDPDHPNHLPFSTFRNTILEQIL